MIYTNRISDPNKTLIENMVDYADTNYGQVPDYIYNQLCGELELDADNELMAVFESKDPEVGRLSTGFYIKL